jgi:hypothetical protein
MQRNTLVTDLKQNLAQVLFRQQSQNSNPQLTFIHQTTKLNFVPRYN